MTILGAIFAGGQARRFGGDKAAALIDGRPMIEHVAERLAAQCDVLVVVGREWPGLAFAPDAPEPGIGPLGALAGALRYARERDHHIVLTSGCDLPDLPLDLAARLSPAPAIVAGQPLLGSWPSALADDLLTHIGTTDERSIQGWIEAAGARQVAIGEALSNINTVNDLERFSRSADRRSSR